MDEVLIGFYISGELTTVEVINKINTFITIRNFFYLKKELWIFQVNLINYNFFFAELCRGESYA